MVERENIIYFDEVRDRSREGLRGYKAQINYGLVQKVAFSLRDLDDYYVICNQSGTPVGVRDDKDDALSLARRLVENAIENWKGEYAIDKVVDEVAWRKRLEAKGPVSS